MKNLLFDFRAYYIASILAVYLIILLWGLRRLASLQKKRVKRARNMDVVEAVETETPDEDSESITRRRAAENIENRFETIRKLFVPALTIFAAILILLPLLPTIHATYISLFAGILAVLIGVASKPIIENAISGMVITFSQPIRINDTVIIDGHYGTVEKITLLYTVIKVWNWRRFVIPNHKMLQKEFENLSLRDELEWTHVEFFVAPGTDILKVKEIAKQAMQGKFLLDNIEAPSFWVMELGKDAIKCWVAGWAADPSASWALRSSTRRNLVMAFNKEKISFQMENSRIHLEKDVSLSNIFPKTNESAPPK